MLRVTLSNRILGIAFQYEYEKGEVLPSTGDGTQGEVVNLYPKRAWCELHRLAAQAPDKDGKVTYKSEAIVARSGALVSQHEPGGFKYDKGRKLSLTRALKQYGLKRDDREIVWHAYLDRPRPISKPKVKARVQPVEEAMINILDLDAPMTGQQADGYREPPPHITRDPVAAAIHRLDLNAGEVH
jgi:hypothetical protein